MGRRSKKNFKEFNSTNIDQINAKHKEIPAGTGKDIKSHRRQGNHIEKKPVTIAEKCDDQRDNGTSFSNEETNYKDGRKPQRNIPEIRTDEDISLTTKDGEYYVSF